MYPHPRIARSISVSVYFAIGFLFVLLTTSTHAGHIITLPTGFTDREDHSITFDSSTGLEWLDVTATRNRSYRDVFADITDTGSPTVNNFNVSDGWRFATLGEFRGLVSKFFDANFCFELCGLVTTFPFGGGDPELVEDFIITFGDTKDAFWDASGWVLDIASDGAGGTYGILSDCLDTLCTFRHLGLVADEESVWRDTRVPSSDVADSLYAGGGLLSAISNQSYDVFGSYLVRTAVDVPEPSTLTLFALSLAGLGIIRRKRYKHI